MKHLVFLLRHLVVISAADASLLILVMTVVPVGVALGRALFRRRHMIDCFPLRKKNPSFGG